MVMSSHHENLLQEGRSSIQKLRQYRFDWHSITQKTLPDFRCSRERILKLRRAACSLVAVRLFLCSRPSPEKLESAHAVLTMKTTISMTSIPSMRHEYLSSFSNPANDQALIICAFLVQWSALHTWSFGLCMVSHAPGSAKRALQATGW